MNRLDKLVRPRGLLSTEALQHSQVHACNATVCMVLKHSMRQGGCGDRSVSVAALNRRLQRSRLRAARTARPQEPPAAPPPATNTRYVHVSVAGHTTAAPGRWALRVAGAPAGRVGAIPKTPAVAVAEAPAARAGAIRGKHALVAAGSPAAAEPPAARATPAPAAPLAVGRMGVVSGERARVGAGSPAAAEPPAARSAAPTAAALARHPGPLVAGSPAPFEPAAARAEPMATTWGDQCPPLVAGHVSSGSRRRDMAAVHLRWVCARPADITVRRLARQPGCGGLGG